MNSTKLYFAILLSVILTTAKAGAEETTLTLKPVDGLKAGLVKNGTIVIRGYVQSNTPHSGFRLSCLSEEDHHLGACLLKGQRYMAHRIQVAINSLAEHQQDGTIFIPTTQKFISFNVQVVGDQQVAADTWTIMMRASAE